jgi:hypothetical protein
MFILYFQIYKLAYTLSIYKIILTEIGENMIQIPIHLFFFNIFFIYFLLLVLFSIFF